MTTDIQGLGNNSSIFQSQFTQPITVTFVFLGSCQPLNQQPSPQFSGFNDIRSGSTNDSQQALNNLIFGVVMQQMITQMICSMLFDMAASGYSTQQSTYSAPSSNHNTTFERNDYQQQSSGFHQQQRTEGPKFNNNPPPPPKQDKLEKAVDNLQNSTLKVSDGKERKDFTTAFNPFVNTLKTATTKAQVNEAIEGEKKEYRKLAKQYHPDRFNVAKHKEEATEIFKLISELHEQFEKQSKEKLEQLP